MGVRIDRCRKYVCLDGLIGGYIILPANYEAPSPTVEDSLMMKRSGNSSLRDHFILFVYLFIYLFIYFLNP